MATTDLDGRELVNHSTEENLILIGQWKPLGRTGVRGFAAGWGNERRGKEHEECECDSEIDVVKSEERVQVELRPFR